MSTRHLVTLVPGLSDHARTCTQDTNAVAGLASNLDLAPSVAPDPTSLGQPLAIATRASLIPTRRTLVLSRKQSASATLGFHQRQTVPIATNARLAHSSLRRDPVHVYRVQQ